MLNIEMEHIADYPKIPTKDYRCKHHSNSITYVSVLTFVLNGISYGSVT